MSKGWIQFPFFATKNSADEVFPEWQFEGLTAFSGPNGASGSIGIPIPAEATSIRRVRVGGNVIQGEVHIIVARSRLGERNKKLSEITIKKKGAFNKRLPIKKSLRELGPDDAIYARITAKKGNGNRTVVQLVAAEFK